MVMMLARVEAQDSDMRFQRIDRVQHGSETRLSPTITIAKRASETPTPVRGLKRATETPTP